LKVKADKMRKKILSLTWEMNWVVKDPALKVDVERVNAWCVKYGYLHKPLNSYTYNELPKLLSQFEALHASFVNSIYKSQV